LAAVGTAAHGQILIGQTAGFSGAVAAGVKETTDGAKIYLDAVNAKGGINGQKIELISMDDKFTPQLAGDNAKTLIENKEVVALFLTRGAPHTQAVLPHLEKHGVPLIGPSTGAMVLHSPVHRQVFNVRATYQREAEKAMTHLASMGITRIALVHADDTFGEDGLVGAQKGLGDNARGVIVTQVSPQSIGFKLDKEAIDLARSQNIAEVSPAMLEGFAAAQVLVEGLRRSGPKPTRERCKRRWRACKNLTWAGLS